MKGAITTLVVLATGRWLWQLGYETGYADATRAYLRSYARAWKTIAGS